VNGAERYADPILASRVRSWMEATAPSAAPERLVFRVMDDVERAPRRGAWVAGRPLLAALARYAALTLVITIGVAGGILLTRGLPNVGGPTAPPSPSRAIPSLRSIGGFDTNGRILTGGERGAWLATAAAELTAIDPVTAAPGEPVQLGFVPSDLAVSIGTGARGGETVWAVAPGHDLLRLDPSVGELYAAGDAAGSRVALGTDAAWVGRQGAVVRIDARLLTNLGSIALPNHRATDPVVVIGDTLWAAEPAGIDRVDVSTGVHATRVSVAPGPLVLAGDVVWAADRGTLHGLDPASGQITRTAALPRGLGAIDAVATHGDTVWVVGSGPGGPLLVGVDPRTGQAVSQTSLTTPAVSIALVGNQVWTLDSGGHIDRYAPGP